MDARPLCPLALKGHCPHGSACPLRHEAVPAPAPALVCIFETKGAGKCPYGSQCPRSHDPRLYTKYWQPVQPVQPPAPSKSLPILTDPGPPAVASFIYNSQFQEDETQVTEFKACAPQNFETEIAVTMLSKYICAFLNTIGGVLYYGITDDHVVKGLVLTSSQRDKLRLGIDQCCNAFHPEVDPGKVSIRFEKVLYSDGGERRDAFVVVIRVQKGDPGVIYFTPDHKAWVKRQASIRELKSTSLVAFIKKKIDGNDDFGEEMGQRHIPDRRYPVWEYYCPMQGSWTEYPEFIQTALETGFQERRMYSAEMGWRGMQTMVDFNWFREAGDCQSWECRRLDWRRMGQGIWWTFWNSQWHRLDPARCQKLDRDYMAEKPDCEVSIEDFIFIVSFDRMRLTGELPLWRLIIP